MAAIVPFLMNMHMEKVLYLMRYSEIYEDPADIAVLCDDITAYLKQCVGELDTLNIVVRSWGQRGVGSAMCHNVSVFLAAGIIKMRCNDFEGLKWCVKEVLKEVGSAQPSLAAPITHCGVRVF
jgi:hypothetical protein